MNDFTDKIDEITNNFLDDYYSSVVSSKRKLWGFTELITKKDQPMPVIVNGTADRGTIPISLDDKYEFISWVRLPGTISTVSSEEDNWGLVEGRRQNAGLRWIIAHRVELGENLIKKLLQYLPAQLRDIPGYEFVFVNAAINTNADHENVYATELGATVYEKHRLDWNIYAVELNIEYKVCEGLSSFILELRDAGIWDRLDFIHVLATQTRKAAKLNLKNANQFKLTEFNDPVFTRNIGYGSSGNVSSYLDTGFIPSVHGVNFTDNDASLFCYSWDDLSETTIDIGSTTPATTSMYISPKLLAPANKARIVANSAIVTDFDNTDSSGLFIASRIDAATFGFSVRGGDHVISSLASSSIPTFSLFLNARNNGGVAANFSKRRLGLIGGGASLVGYESALNTAWNNYLLSLE